jgi:hypothetical protein
VLDHQRDRSVASQARIAVLRCAGSPSPSKVAFSPPKKAAQLAEDLDEGVGPGGWGGSTVVDHLRVSLHTRSR